MVNNLLSKKEQDFQVKLAELKVEIEASIVRPTRPWMSSLYVFRFRKNRKWSEAFFIPWKDDGGTFPDILTIVRSAK